MNTVIDVKIILLITCFFSMHFITGQNYVFKISKTNEYCTKANAQLKIEGLGSKDSVVSVNWSTGENNVFAVSQLEGGDHNINIRVKYKDTIVTYRDTTLHFVIEKTECKVSFDKYFSPNDDSYHDVFNIGNISFYPNFEFQVFNKWGTRVHLQKDTFTPWDGKWNGINLPDGTYFFVFFYDASNKNKLEKGNVTILR